MTPGLQCTKCKNELKTKLFKVASYTDCVGSTKIFDTIEEASVYLQQMIHKHNSVSFEIQYNLDF